jgi:hypothetical protein
MAPPKPYLQYEGRCPKCGHDGDWAGPRHTFHITQATIQNWPKQFGRPAPDALVFDCGRCGYSVCTLPLDAPEKLAGKPDDHSTVAGVRRAYHVQLDALGAPEHESPCIRVGKLVQQLTSQIEALQQHIAEHSPATVRLS